MKLSRRCKSSRGQRRATSPGAKPAGGRRQTSEAGWSKAAGSVSSRESCLQVVVPQGRTTPRIPEPRAWEVRTVSARWNAVSARSLQARQGGGHRGRRPDHVATGITRELVRASSASGLESAEQHGGAHSGGSPPRDQSSRWKGPRPRRVGPSINTRGRQVRRDERERGGSPDGREAVLAEHRSDGLTTFPNNRTRARRRASPAGRHVCAGSNEAGKPGNQHRPWDLVQRRRRRASSPNQGGTGREHPGGARDFEPGAHPATTGTDRHSGTCISRHGVYHARPPPG